MIKALLLIFSPVPTWERIALARRHWAVVLATYLIPLLLLGCLAEGYGLYHWGKPRGQIPHLQVFSTANTLVFEVAQFLLSLGVVFLGAKLIKSLGETFHGRHSYSETFTVATYALSPLFLLRVLDAFPGMPPWLTWAIGMSLSVSLLYHGLPRVMKPDPPHAFGLFLTSAMFLVVVTGLLRFVTAWYLKGKFVTVDEFVSHLLGAFSH